MPVAPSPKKRLLFAGLLILAGLALGSVVWVVVFRPRLNFPRSDADYYQNDPQLGHRHRAHVRREFPWPEHPRGRIVMQTNNLGMRRDDDVRIDRPAGTSRILVVGDSHLDGVVYNSENFATVLETLLNRHSKHKPIQVLNVSAGHYGPRHYQVSLDAYYDLDPRMVVIGFYSGNDFLDVVKDVEAQLPSRLPRPDYYQATLRKADRLHAGSVAQVLNQTYYLKVFPDMWRPVLRRTADIFRELHQHAASRGVALRIILIPTKWDVEPDRMPAEFHEASKILGIATQDLNITAALRLELKQELEAMGIPCWDPTVEMQQARTPLYWNRDFHLNVAGHLLLAELFAPELFSILSGWGEKTQ